MRRKLVANLSHRQSLILMLSLELILAKPNLKITICFGIAYNDCYQLFFSEKMVLLRSSPACRILTMLYSY
ncbi:hypothetical protein Golob_021236, partial [Gossypium lobatum]|nr:hypothetical protein [Gossypium lobatum]